VLESSVAVGQAAAASVAVGQAATATVEERGVMMVAAAKVLGMVQEDLELPRG
jgi:hypothetical protein